MQIVNSGNTYTIYGDVRLFDRLPRGTYRVAFSQLKGFYLVSVPDLEATEKTYGDIERRASKIMRSFDLFDRSMGVLLLGSKGMGKTMLIRILANRFYNKDLPVIIVSSYFEGLADYLSTIDQEALIVFDEFEKVFDTDDQEELLPLFDGLSHAKHLYAVSGNSEYSINEYLINRPGRFHYRFNFNLPSKEEIREYLNDVLSEEYSQQIETVVKVSEVANISYDSLRAIVFEIIQGENIEQVINDLNIEIESIKLLIQVLHNDGKLEESTLRLNNAHSGEWVYLESGSIYVNVSNIERAQDGTFFIPLSKAKCDDDNIKQIKISFTEKNNANNIISQIIF